MKTVVYGVSIAALLGLTFVLIGCEKKIETPSEPGKVEVSQPTKRPSPPAQRPSVKPSDPTTGWKDVSPERYERIFGID